jgi:hypothetical protein
MDPVIFFWLAVAAIAVSAIYFRHQTAAKRSQVIQAMVEKGVPLPPDLFQEPRRRAIGSHTFIAAGILLLGTAAACLVFFWALTSSQFGIPNHNDAPQFLIFISAFPFFIGIACLLVGRYFKSHE